MPERRPPTSCGIIALSEPLYGTFPSIPSGTSFDDLVGVFLEVAVLRAGLHRADRAHAAVRLERAALVEDRLARRLVGAGEERADHHAVRARGDAPW